MSLFEILIKYQEGFISGILVTLELSLFVWIIGLLFGGLFGWVSSKYPIGFGIPFQIIAFVLSGIPVLVFLFWMHYPLQSLLNIRIDPFFTTVLTLSVINIFTVSDIVKNAIQAIPRQFIEVADVCGVSPKKRFWKIELPLLFRSALSPFIIVQVNMLHMTLFASLISVDEIFRIVQRVNSIVYSPVEIYTALGLFFLIISLPLNGLALWIKDKYARDFSER